MSTFTLTFTQCKNIAEMGLDLREVVESLNDQPDWLMSMGGIEDMSELAAIQQVGCASSVYLPAITYHIAASVMAEHGDDVLEYIESVLGDVPPPKAGQSWGGLAPQYLSTAVEMWCRSQIDVSDSSIEY